MTASYLGRGAREQPYFNMAALCKIIIYFINTLKYAFKKSSIFFFSLVIIRNIILHLSASERCAARAPPLKQYRLHCTAACSDCVIFRKQSSG